jgi:hypothetical protein
LSPLLWKTRKRGTIRSLLPISHILTRGRLKREIGTTDFTDFTDFEEVWARL